MTKQKQKEDRVLIREDPRMAGLAPRIQLFQLALLSATSVPRQPERGRG